MILRSLYAVLVRLHPHRFRREFGEEMLWIFDQARNWREATALLVDGMQSLATQWIFRSELDEQNQFASAGGPPADRVPQFYTSDSDMPSPIALINGLGLAVGLFALASAALFYGGRQERVFTYYGNDFHAGPPENRESTIGPSTPRGRPRQEGDSQPSFWSKVGSLLHKTPPERDVEDRNAQQAPGFETASASHEASAPQPKIDPPGFLERFRQRFEGSPGMSTNARRTLVPPPAPGAYSSPQPSPFPEEGRQRLAVAYFRTVLILQALDTNHDGVISAEEMEKAPAALRTLDQNNDGKLEPDECGMHIPPVKMDQDGKPVSPNSNPAEVKRRKEAVLRARFLYMHLYPVTHTLDLNHDGVISADEIRNAPAALATLDLDGDGRLTLNELQPDAVAHEIAGLFVLDSNLDGNISRSERLTPFGQHVSALLDAADRNHDGQVTWEELEDEITLRADLDHDGVVTWEEMMKARKSGLLGVEPIPNTPRFRSPGAMPHHKSQPSTII